MLEGILLIDKEKDFTSFDVVAKMRGIGRTKKAGHAGTLDPMATGLLPIFFGRATKACDIFPIQDKTYVATFKTGISTDTLDITGEVVDTSDVVPTESEVREILAQFMGKQMQLPPMYSAVRVNGRRLYDLARQGVEVERNEREIEIHSISYIEYLGENTHKIEVSCSKGTYIRTLCHDIGVKLGSCATLTELRRTEACGFSLEGAITLGEAQILANENTLAEKIIPVQNVFDSLHRLDLSEKDADHYIHGVRFTARRFKVNEKMGDIAVYGANKEFLGISYVNEAGLMVSKKLFKTING